MDDEEFSWHEMQKPKLIILNPPKLTEEYNTDRNKLIGLIQHYQSLPTDEERANFKKTAPICVWINFDQQIDHRNEFAGFSYEEQMFLARFGSNCFIFDHDVNLREKIEPGLASCINNNITTRISL